jgi:signal transduction histidine kinase
MSSPIRDRLRLHSVRARLTFWYLLTLGAGLLAFAVFVFVMRVDTLYHELDADLEVRLHQAFTDQRTELFALDVGDELARSEHARASGLLVREAPGAFLFRSPGFPNIGWAEENSLARAARDGVPVVAIADRTGAGLHVATLRIDRPGAPTLALQLSAPTEPVTLALDQLAGELSVAILVVLLVASWGSGITARRALAPVDQIVARARHIQAEKLGERLDVHAGSAELDRLVETLNDMLDRLEAAMRTARRFAADASHELQTPLAAMRSVVEASVRRARGVEDYQAMAADLLVEIDRSSRLVRDLRLLALAEGGQVVTAGDRIDLATMVSECSEIARAMGEEKAIRVDARIEQRPVVLGSALHLRRVILNLTDNAIRYSPAGAGMEILVAGANGQASVRVSDHGCGIAPEDLPHIFEAFYRADPARARETGGTGLGLAIADQIVRAHGGAITVASEPGAGSTFTMTLPLAPNE